MQQTSIDRWLRKAFVYVCKVYCNTLPTRVPDGVTLEESGDDAAGRYRYCFTVSNDKQMSELTALLESRDAEITKNARAPWNATKPHPWPDKL
jgi:hypothetical protein